MSKMGSGKKDQEGAHQQGWGYFHWEPCLGKNACSRPKTPEGISKGYDDKKSPFSIQAKIKGHLDSPGITSKHGKFRLRIAMSIFTWNVYVSTCCWKSKWSKWFVNIFHDTLRNLHEFYMCYQVLANWKSIILSHCSTSRCIHGFDERTCNSR